MEVMSGIQTAVEGVQLTVKHVAGAVSLWMGEGQEKAVSVGAQLERPFEKVRPNRAYKRDGEP
jgi:hypothetical protein